MVTQRPEVIMEEAWERTEGSDVQAISSTIYSFKSADLWQRWWEQTAKERPTNIVTVTWLISSKHNKLMSLTDAGKEDNNMINQSRTISAT